MEEFVLFLSENDKIVEEVLGDLGERVEVILEVEAILCKVPHQVPVNDRVERGVEMAPIVMDVVLVMIEVLTVGREVMKMIRKSRFNSCTSELCMRIEEVLNLHRSEVSMKLISSPWDSDVTRESVHWL